MSAVLKPEQDSRDTRGHLSLERRQQVQDTLLDRMAAGESVSTICRSLGLAKSMPWEWCKADQAFAERYAQARVYQAHALADETLAIADGTDPSASPDPAIRRIQVDTRKWMTGKIAPKLYGDRLETNVTLNVAGLHLQALQRVQSIEVGTTDQQALPPATVDAEVVDASDVTVDD